MAGAVPIYLGAPNIDDFVPGENSYINIRDFNSADDLIDYLNFLNENDSAYLKFFDWKKNGFYFYFLKFIIIILLIKRIGLSKKYQTHLDNCAHQAECRICREVLKRNKN